MSTKPNIIFLSPSGGGKSTACEYLAKFYKYYDFHPYRFVKKQYETLYKLPAGYLDTAEGKEDRAPGMPVTFQEMMKQEYHFRRQTDPLYVSRNIASELNSVLQEGRPIALQAIRNLEELEEIFKLGISYHLIEILGRGQLISSDENYSEIKRQLFVAPQCENYESFDNSGEKEKLYEYLFLYMTDMLQIPPTQKTYPSLEVLRDARMKNPEAFPKRELY